MTKAGPVPFPALCTNVLTYVSHWPSMELTSSWPLAIMASMRLELPMVPTIMFPAPAAAYPVALEPTDQSLLMPVTLKITDELAVACPDVVRVPLRPVTRPKSRAKSCAARRTPGQSAASACICTGEERDASSVPLPAVKATVGFRNDSTAEAVPAKAAESESKPRAVLDRSSMVAVCSFYCGAGVKYRAAYLNLYVGGCLQDI